MKKSVLINHQLCNGCGNCVIACPGNASRGIDSKGGFGPRREAALVIGEGGGVFLDERICIRSLSKPCKTCRDVCPAGAVTYPDEHGFSSLEKAVISRGICSGCGGCVSACPEAALEMDEYPVLTGECTNCGYCLLHCPRNPEENVDLFSFKMWDTLGHIRQGFKIRAAEAPPRAQDGGFVTVLLAHLLEKGIIDAAVVTGEREDEPWRAEAVLAASPEELYETAGSKYSNSGCLQMLKKAKEEGFKRVAVVGLPCQIEGLLKLYTSSSEDLGYCNIIALSIGLFCKGNFYYQGVKKLVERRTGTTLSRVDKLDIKGKFFTVKASRGSHRIPLNELLEHKREGCNFCSDFTSKLSDFSVGSVGSPGAFSTVIVRSSRAEKMLNLVISEGLVEATPLDDDDKALISRLAKSKVKTALKRINHFPESNSVTDLGVSSPLP